MMAGADSHRGGSGRFTGRVPQDLQPMTLQLIRCTYGFVLALLCRIDRLDVDRVRAQLALPGERTLDPHWREANEVHAMAIYLINTAMDVPAATIAKALDLHKSSVSRALTRIEDRRDERKVARLIDIAETAMKEGQS